MLLAADIGNSSTTFAVYSKEGRLEFRFDLSSITRRYEDEYVLLMQNIMNNRGLKGRDISGAIISSVVPPLTNIIGNAIVKFTGQKPIVVGPGIKTGLNIKIDNHTQLGADFVANTVAASTICEKPYIVIDMGTATTLTVVNSENELCGVLIIPGIRIALDSLSANTAELPYITMEHPRGLIGTNTVDAMNSGIIYGSACMLDGLIDRLFEELGTENISIIATGRLANLVLPYCRHNIIFSPNLILDGLYTLYKLNQKKHRPKKAPVFDA